MISLLMASYISNVSLWAAIFADIGWINNQLPPKQQSFYFSAHPVSIVIVHKVIIRLTTVLIVAGDCLEVFNEKTSTR